MLYNTFYSHIASKSELSNLRQLCSYSARVRVRVRVRVLPAQELHIVHNIKFLIFVSAKMFSKPLVGTLFFPL